MTYVVWFVGAFVIPNKPYWRQFCYRNWARGFARIANMRIEVIGPVPSPPFFLVVNHLSYMDIPAIRAVVDGVFVAKAEIRDWFVAGKIISDMGRSLSTGKIAATFRGPVQKIISKLSDGEGVIVFPEGTSTKGEDVLPFNSSFLEFAARDRPACLVRLAQLPYAAEASRPRASPFAGGTTHLS